MLPALPLGLAPVYFLTQNERRFAMATKEQKSWAMHTAIDLVKNSPRGGQNGAALSVELNGLYRVLLELKEDADKN